MIGWAVRRLPPGVSRSSWNDTTFDILPGEYMDHAAQPLKLYELLTQEIQAAESQTYQVVSVGAGAIAAILAAGFNQRDHVLRLFMFLTSYLIIFPMVRLLSGNRSRIWRIATYMRVYLEPELPGVQWQTHLARSAALRPGSTFIIGSQMMIVQLATAVVGAVVFIDLCILAKWTGASFLPGMGSFDGFAATAAGAAAVANGAVLWYEARIERNSRRGGPVERSWLQSWEGLRISSSAPNRTGSQD